MTAPYGDRRPDPYTGQCPWCERSIRVRRDGRLFRHNDLDPREARLLGSARCEGSDRRPETAHRAVETLTAAGARL